MDARSAHAMIRFGLGRRGDEPAPADPLSWLARQLDGADPALGLPITPVGDAVTAWRDSRMKPVPPGQLDLPHALWQADLAITMRTLVETELPFRERLVWFWANHFTVSARKGEIRSTMLPFVQEAIRPHVTGRFADMLGAVIRHPAMLWYLDNVESVGPHSKLGLRSGRGINENLARECLELHTIGPQAGYTQADVTEFAKILSGWAISDPGRQPAFAFHADRHEPGEKVLMGLTFSEGEAGGTQALTWLGNHPMSFHHVATKLVRHFVADDPPPADIKRIAGVLRDTHGDLKAASLEITRLPSAWQPMTKLRPPADYVVAAVRALDLPDGNRPDMAGLMATFGQPFMTAPLPNGWPDTAASWADGEMLLRRADWALIVSGRRPELDPVQLAQSSLGALLTADTLGAVRRATSHKEAVALLLASPEFQRR